MTKTRKERIDKLLVEGGFAVSRTAAQAMVMAGVVLVDDKRVEKASELFDALAKIRIKGDADELRFVGRGGLKLQKALDYFHIRPAAYVCLDVGSSTGGFTDCLLQNGAARVVAIDSGTNQMVWKLRTDPRVDLRENTNARSLAAGDFDKPFDLVVVDVSFISVRKILPVLPAVLKDGGGLVVLIKPQFEVGKGEVGKGGVVRDADKQSRVVSEVADAAALLGFALIGVTDSPILGAAGNKEFLAYFRLQKKDLELG